MKDAVKKYWAVALMFLMVTAVCLLFSCRKSGMFIDEIYTYGLSNSSYAPYITDIKGGSATGVFYALMTLDQLLRGQADGGVCAYIPALTIDDAPRTAMRALSAPPQAACDSSGRAASREASHESEASFTPRRFHVLAGSLLTVMFSIVCSLPLSRCCLSFQGG